MNRRSKNRRGENWSGDAYSENIIKGRSYKREDGLVQKKIIPQVTYDRIKDQIVAKRE